MYKYKLKSRLNEADPKRIEFQNKRIDAFKKKVAEGPGASLGKGPKAGTKGVTNNYYTKNFKYKLVNPKKLAAQSKAIDTKYLWGEE